jgi:hypothetical protein
MSFQWNPRFPSEREAVEPLPFFLYVFLYLIVEGAALAIVVPGLPGGAIPWGKVIHDAFAVPFFIWMALSCLVYWIAYDTPALYAAAHNASRWDSMTRWQRQSRSGLVVLESVILAPEPDLAERMLTLEGEPPNNPGKVMTLADIGGADDVSRHHALLEALFTPLAARLASVAKSFEIVAQCDDGDMCSAVLAVWKKLELPDRPTVRWLDNTRDVGFADAWFEEAPRPWYEQDRSPKYRLLLAWHLNRGGPDVEHKHSESAVALLLGTPALMREKPDVKRQAWLLRQITGDADQVDRLLALLLKAEQVPIERIRHFWHSGLKGLAQHATLGAVRETNLKVESHVLDLAIGPQAPVARWLIQALAAKMAHFGQGAQIVALPHGQGVALNVIAKEPERVAVPWKEEYGYRPILGPEIGVFASLWMVSMLLSPDKDWSTPDTVITCFFILVMVVSFFIRHPGLFSRMVESTVDFVAGVIGF